MADLLNPRDEIGLNGSTTPPENGERHEALPEPLQQVAQALTASSQAPVSGLDASVKAKQRDQLFALAKQKFMPSESPVPQAVPEKPSPARWFMWMGGFAAVAAVAVLAVVVVPRLNLGSRGTVTLQPGAIVRLLIPEAHAGDAFSLYAEKSDAAGIAADTSFIVKTNVDVTKEQFTQTLRMVPAVEVAIAQTANDTFKVTPAEPLKPGTVYRFTMAAQVKKADGSLQTRDFAWALQTKNDLRVLSTIPGDKSSRVPLNTGIEFKFTYPDVADIEKNFEIKPQVAGRFEAHGRSVAFVPNKPLDPGVQYVVTLKKGAHVKDSSLALAEDVLVRFETEPARQNQDGYYYYKPTWNVNEFGEVPPGKEVFLSSWNYDQRFVSSTIAVTGYSLTDAETIDLLNSRFTIPAWAPVESSRYADYKRLAKNQAFQLSVPVVQASQYSSYTIVLPKIDRVGAYAIKFLPKDGEETWMLLQVTEHATYFLGDKNTLQAWVVAATTQKVAGNTLVKSGPVQGRTDASGVVKLPTELLSSTSTNASGGNKDFFIVDVGEGADVYHILFWKNNVKQAWDFNWDGFALDKTWSYAFIDRPLYRGTDDVNVAGFAQDRESHRGVGDLTIQLSKQSYWYDWFGNEKIYQEKTVKTDDAGNYQTSFHWDDMAQGYYRVVMLRDGKKIGQRVFEIRDFVKPAFFINVTTDQTRYYAGDPVTGSINVRFYDGTPLAKGKFTLDIGRAYDAKSSSIELVTDENGSAKFTIPAPAVMCYPGFTEYCGSSEEGRIAVRSAEGEEAEIVGTASFQVFATDLQTELTPATSGTAAMITFRTLRSSLGENVQPQPWGNRTLKGHITVTHWDRIDNGTYYDFYQKKVMPQYRYNRVTDPAIDFDVTTDGNGNGRYAFTMEKGKDYQVSIEGLDDKGRKMRAQAYLAIGWYDYRQAFFQDSYDYQQSLVDTTPQLVFDPEDKQSFAEDETVKMRYQIGKNALDTSKTPGVLFVVASRGLRQTVLSAGPSWSLKFDKNLIPSADVRAITFKDDHFEVVKRTVAVDVATREIKFEIQPDQQKYAPGATVKLRVIATDAKTKEHVPNAYVTVAAVDKSLEPLTYFIEESPLANLYGYVSDGITLEVATNNLRPASSDFGAEKGGGGGDGDSMAAQVRRNFKDTAAFVTGTTGQNGEVTLTFKAPDNLTTWRTQLVGVTPDVRAGAVKIEIPVTKQAFVDVVAPPRLLAKDKPVIKLRAYGVALKENDAVSYVVDAPTLGIRNQRVDGKAFQASYVGIDKLVPGRHAVILKVTTPRGTDALERIVTIVDTRFTQDVETVVEAIPGASLPDIGTAEEREIRFESKAQGSMLPQVRSLSYADWSPRVDAQIASRMMKKLLIELYKDKYVTMPEDSLRDYMNGGIKLLPYASPDPELTSEVAATAPELFDENAMKSYFYDVLENKNASRELQISSLAGLAALHEPVLPMLQTTAAQTDLTWREQLVVARGLVAAGDREAAGAILESLLKKSQTRGTVTWLAVSKEAPEIYEATADAAALAASLGHAKAEALMNYIEQNWSNEAFPLLAKARYLATVAPMRPAGDVSLSYSTDGKTEKTVSLREWPVDTVTLTAEEAKAFRVTKVTGPIVISFVKRVAGRPETKPEVNVSRRYEAPSALNDLHEGDTVRIHLIATWQPTAQDGCYSLRDHLPGGFEPVISFNRYAPDYDYGYKIFDLYPYEVKDGEVAFYVCKRIAPTEITYSARVVSRGIYMAEAPVLQHVEHPSVAAVGTDQAVTIK